MKTSLEWYNELPEPIRTKAINNTSKDIKVSNKGSLFSAINFGFVWSESPEGYKYWSSIATIIQVLEGLKIFSTNLLMKELLKNEYYLQWITINLT